MTLSYPQHFLVDLENMTAEERDARRQELIAWTQRYATSQANPKWAEPHLFELARLNEIAVAERDELLRQLRDLQGD